ncbi:nucleoside-diphosphate sugar epimerase [Brevibacterium casei]|uniref:Nucleoside-diphosphate-sugar epimerase n=1 Tax=Brevibacterium casei S18 TaxID=1229781 RepID=K9ALW6_9MICO|nr:nucleoside-diphosphate sugar epimerase [Brevibacterium casei]EKU47051.1 nucleoside-diphosphate-sugar epimerase [Brevibacterium casei S18]
MRSALVLGFGQIGTQIAHDLAAAGTDVRVMTRSRPEGLAVTVTAVAHRAGLDSPASHSGTEHADPAAGSETVPGTEPVATAPGRISWSQGDASSPEAVRRAAEEIGAEAIFACVHTAYDSRVWARTLPGLEAAILDAAAALDLPVVFPESVYAFAGLTTPITADADFAPVEEKGRIRRQLLEARSAHSAQVASVLAGDLIGATASPSSSVVRLCITDRIAAGRRAVVPARTDVPHGITVIDDMAAAMIAVAQLLESGEGVHRLIIAPSANPTLADVAAYTHDAVGTPYRTPIALPHAAVRATGWFDRSMFELAELAPIWRRPCRIESDTESDWRAGIDAMLR